MTDDLTDPQQWARRAEDARREAEEAMDAEQKKLLLEIAALYDQLVKRLGVK